MTATPHGPRHLLTVEEYAALGEDEYGRYELQEGSLVRSPGPTPDHANAIGRLYLQLVPVLPSHLEVILDVDVNLALVPAHHPGFVRRPDLVIADKAARRRVRVEGGLIRASEVLVATEIVSPGSRRLDNVTKRGEYADAGIPHYWIVDIDPPVSLVACYRTDEFGYLDHGSSAGSFATDNPFPVKLDLTQLR